MRILKFIDYLFEIDIKHKDGIKGSYNKVFPFVNADDKVIKIGKQAIEHGKLFLKYPEYCPIVYKIVDTDSSKYIIIEKLDVINATIDYDNLINKDIGYVHNWGYKSFKIKTKFNEIRNRITTEKGRLMFDRIKEIVLSINMQDIHARNFGYDKNGVLKALDI